MADDGLHDGKESVEEDILWEDILCVAKENGAPKMDLLKLKSAYESMLLFKAPPSEPPCTCDRCRANFIDAEECQCHCCIRGYDTNITDTQTSATVLEYLKLIHMARSWLAGGLAHHADTLMSRWRKRSVAKRAALLRDTRANLEDFQWVNSRYPAEFDFEEFRNGSYEESSKMYDWREHRRLHLLLLWLNIEVLKTNTAVLFALLHFRSSYSAQDWASWDNRRIDVAWRFGWVRVDFSPKFMLMQGPLYGTLVDWDEQMAHRGEILSFSRGKLILEAQSYLMRFLCTLVNNILVDVDKSHPARTEKWKEQTLNGFRQLGCIENWSSYTHQAFSAPPRFDIDYLVSQAETRFRAMHDYLTDLQCDTNYLRRHIKGTFETSLFKDPKMRTCHGESLAYTICRDIYGCFWWRCTEIELRHVQGLFNEFKHSIKPGSPLPSAYDEALGALELLLTNQMSYMVRCLQLVFPYAPGFSKHYHIEHGNCAGGCYDKVVRTDGCNYGKNAPRAMKEDPLEWCLSRISCGGEEFDFAEFFAFLEDYLTKCSCKEAARVDKVLWSMLDDISTCHELLASVRPHRPQNTLRTWEEAKLSERRKGWARQTCYRTILKR